ncbi:hypothetical protein MAPG_07534 [Magnaporthiopsis poae ATCC 64411]|uniref:Protein kinase domain-containing protein n=1 Tax=Magnaporthiopsis poae (strain ATCC 64411 / 73-15) TaxID=644358 RepID=A0A0C4E4X9_MAGP6|nr:hypothetical protein MAPG_07534 [Magnaporthiopsis poae ATCC 64411]
MGSRTRGQKEDADGLAGVTASERLKRKPLGDRSPQPNWQGPFPVLTHLMSCHDPATLTVRPGPRTLSSWQIGKEVCLNRMAAVRAQQLKRLISSAGLVAWAAVLKKKKIAATPQAPKFVEEAAWRSVLLGPAIQNASLTLWRYASLGQGTFGVVMHSVDEVVGRKRDLWVAK